MRSRDRGTRERVLQACVALLRHGGPEAASQRAICERAGVTAPTLYHHFGDLGRLHVEAVDDVLQNAIVGKHSDAPADPIARLRHGWDAYIAFARNEPGTFMALARKVVGGPLPAPALRSFEALVTNVRALGTNQAIRHDPETGAQMLWAAAHGVACLMLAGTRGFEVQATLSDSLREATLAALIAPAAPNDVAGEA